MVAAGRQEANLTKLAVVGTISSGSGGRLVPSLEPKSLNQVRDDLWCRHVDGVRALSSMASACWDHHVTECEGLGE